LLLVPTNFPAYFLSSLKSKVFTFNDGVYMRKLTRCCSWAFVTLLSIYFFSACEKENEQDTFIPFLTERLWSGDTITINPPLTYEQLSIEDQQSFHTATLWFKNAQITLNENGTVKSGGNYDLGYKRWRLVDNDADIEMTLDNGDKLILRNWLADPANFSYTSVFTTASKISFDCTFNYK
jgi:hypothetical protein